MYILSSLFNTIRSSNVDLSNFISMTIFKVNTNYIYAKEMSTLGVLINVQALINVQGGIFLKKSQPYLVISHLGVDISLQNAALEVLSH